MLEGLIGKKIGIMQNIDEEGKVFPVTLIRAGPCTVFQKKTQEKDGYSRLQLGLVEDKGQRRSNKPFAGHAKKADAPPPRILREFRFDEQAEVKEGDQFYVDIFHEGENVSVVGRSKGKGFAGVKKRWGFRGGKVSHGSMFHRAPGSIGASAFPSRVVKGKKLPGHMGSKRVTVKNLIVVKTDKENNLLILRGSVPGAVGSYLQVKKAGYQSAVSEGKAKPQEKAKAEDKSKAEDKN